MHEGHDFLLQDCDANTASCFVRTSYRWGLSFLESISANETMNIRLTTDESITGRILTFLQSQLCKIV